MKYITGLHALNLQCCKMVHTFGDWHSSGLDWDNVDIRDTKDSIYGMYGVEKINDFYIRTDGIKDGALVANHIRAFLDILSSGKYVVGIRNDIIDNEDYTDEIVNQAKKLLGSKVHNKVNKFMSLEYRDKWESIDKMNEYSKVRDLQYHHNVMYSIIRMIEQYNRMNREKYVLKGGTALQVYGSNRYSTDIDLDANGYGDGIDLIVEDYCRISGVGYNISKNTNTVKRFKIHYDNTNTMLKVEVSYRNMEPLNRGILGVTWFNNILVYDINVLAEQKIRAYINRFAIRDLYDLVFLLNNNMVRNNVKNNILATLYQDGADNVLNRLYEKEDDVIRGQLLFNLENEILRIFS